jgi:hypothetical protein
VHEGDDMPMRSGQGLTEAEDRRAAELEAEATGQETRRDRRNRLRRPGQAEHPSAHLAGDVKRPSPCARPTSTPTWPRTSSGSPLTGGLMVAILALLTSSGTSWE